jgi:hypothetical protein
MNKLIMFVVTLVTIFSFSISAEASTKVWWDGVELKPGQFGRVTILKETSLFKVETFPSGEIKVFDPVRRLHPGETYRVYGTKYIQGYTPLYSVGGGYYVLQNTSYNGILVNYETPSKAKLALVNKR